MVLAKKQEIKENKIETKKNEETAYVNIRKNKTSRTKTVLAQRRNGRSAPGSAIYQSKQEELSMKKKTYKPVRERDNQRQRKKHKSHIGFHPPRRQYRRSALPPVTLGPWRCGRPRSLAGGEFSFLI
jgi:hypothetical protein